MYKILVIALLLISGITSASAQRDWELSTEKDGVRIYTSMVPDSKIKAIKVEGEFNATPSQLVALIMDVNSSAEWVYHVKSSVLVKRVSPSELYYYSEVTLPWPLTNRDFVAHLIVSRNPVTKVVTIDGPAVAGFVPVKEGVIRVIDSKGKWIITPIGPNRIKVEYTIHVDPGGTLPSWLVNTFATEGPLKIFRGIKEQLQKRANRDRDADFAFVEN
ncbi:MAG TPA: START domain-containing protein [Mucilaginibacter sp.]|jgi:ribosome-associated toxin RatA of RatAB toxin-antitoxin module